MSTQQISAPQTRQVFNFTAGGDNSVLAGIAGKSIKISKIALAAVMPVNVNVFGLPLLSFAVRVEAQDFPVNFLSLLAAGLPFVLTLLNNVSVGGFIEYELN